MGARHRVVRQGRRIGPRFSVEFLCRVVPAFDDHYGMQTKMSKTRGYVVLPEEVVRDVFTLVKDYEFRDLAGRLVDWKLTGVWLQPGRGFLTSIKYGRRPVFLHVIGYPVPAFLAGWATMQHSEEHDYWLGLLKRFDYF